MVEKLVDITTPRRTLLVAGLVLIALGVAAFIFDWSNADPIALPLAKRIVFIVIGLAFQWVAEIWTTEWKRSVAAVFGIVLIPIGLVALFAHDLGFMHAGGPWEGVLYLAMATVQGVALWWPRRFYDYEWGTGWSSGLKWASRTDAYQEGRAER